jgi:hypothetical protein
MFNLTANSKKGSKASKAKTSKRDKAEQPSRLQTAKSGKDFVALVALGGLIVGGVSLATQVLLFFAYVGIASKPAPSLVQMVDGQAVKVATMGNKERSPQVVQRFVTDSLMLMMSWSNALPPQTDASGNAKVTTDPGMKVSTGTGDKRITTSAFQASFTVSEKFRNDLVKMLAEMTPVEVFNGQAQTALIFQAVTVPEQVGNGEWKIAVVGTLVKTKVGSADTDRVPFNKEILVRAVDTPPLPQGGKFSNPLESAVYAIRQAGLEIVSMKDIEVNATN